MSIPMYQLHDLMVNIYLIVEDDGLTLVDTGTASGPRVVQRALAKYGYQLSDVKRILITHSDPDHTGGAAILKALSGAQLYASAGEAAALREGQPSRQMRGGRVTQALAGLSERMMPIPTAFADEIVSDGDTLPILGGLTVIGTPGHTPDHVSYYAPSLGVLFAGDSLRATAEGLRCDDAPVMWNYDLARESARKQAALSPRMVCCGHGPVVTDAAGKFPF